jgi:S-adenosylmethionine:tRNA ribosyltransferase-isomerase
MHAEHFEVPAETAEAVNRARAEGRRVVAVGTTSVRSLESAAAEDGTVRPGTRETSIFIYPGYRFRAIDGLFTNFHTPESTLIMLVAAFAGRELILETYREAVERRYRFFSYGDAMLIL